MDETSKFVIVAVIVLVHTHTLMTKQMPSNFQFVSPFWGVGEMTQRLKALAALPES